MKERRTRTPAKMRMKAIEEASGLCSNPTCYTGKAKLEIHHIDGRRSTSYDHRLENLLPLCGSCHIPFTKNEKSEKEAHEWKKLLGRKKVLSAVELLANAHSQVEHGNFIEAEADLRLFDKHLCYPNDSNQLNLNLSALKTFVWLRMQQGITWDVFDPCDDLLTAAEGLNNPDLLLEIYMVRGSAKRMKGRIGEAIENDLAASTYLSRIDEPLLKAERTRWIFSNIANKLTIKGEYEKARRMNEISLNQITSALEKQFPEGIAETYIRSCSTLMQIDAIESANDYLRNARENASRSDRNWITGIVEKVALILALKELDYDAAKTAFQRSWQINNGIFGFQEKELIRIAAQSPECVPDHIAAIIIEDHKDCRFCDSSDISTVLKCKRAHELRFLLFHDPNTLKKLRRH